MPNIFSLDNLREELEQKYAPLQIEVGSETLVLRNVLRLPKEDRKKVMDAMKALDKSAESDDDAVEAAMHDILSAVTKDGKGPKLVKAVGDDLALGMKILEAWLEATQGPEAQNSPA